MAKEDCGPAVHRSGVGLCGGGVVVLRVPLAEAGVQQNSPLHVQASVG